MSTGTTHDVPACLERLRRRFDRWRQTRDGRSRIPDALWASAVKAAGRHGLHRTVRALRLDYYSLKKRVDAGASHDGSGRREVAKLAAGRLRRGEFIELAPVASACSPECVLELEHPDGAKLRMRLTGMPASDLAALSRSFWGLET